MPPYPTHLERQEDRRLVIQWSDGMRRAYRPGELRKACPCATCREKRSGEERDKSKSLLRVIAPHEAEPLAVAHMEPVGNYAYKIIYSDGHDTGIYTFEFLRELGEEMT
ncbi:MAG: DUF971 domain-containing protein [Planctomycetes bacterium]|nr:DUF971 domain-containing protein [Planctomycetota bacterium]